MKNDPEILRDIILIFNDIAGVHYLTSEQIEESNRYLCEGAEEAKTSRKALQGMKMAFNDIFQEMEELTSEEKLLFAERVKQKCGVSLLALEGKIANQIKRIVKKGRISDEYEYYLIREAAESAFADDRKDNREKFDQLITVFEEGISQH